MNADLTVTVLQADLEWENKEKNLELFESRIEKLPSDAEIVVLPEMFSTGFSMKPELLAETMDGPTVEWMRNTAANHHIILCGSLIIEEEGQFYNRLIWMLPNGQHGIYDKRHLFAYAGEHQHYTAGTKRLIASVKGWRINLIICYDLRFPVWCRQQPVAGEMEYDALICVANWPERRSRAWTTLLQARAIENQCYVVGANRVGNDGNDIYYSGESMIIDPLGDVVYQKSKLEDSFTTRLSAEHLNAVREKLPFWKDADHFSLLNQ